MSYTLIKKINNQLLKEVPSVFFPFQYGTIGALLSGLMIPILGTEALNHIAKEFKNKNLNVDKGNLSDLKVFIDSFNDSLLSEITEKVFEHINNEYFGNLQNFFCSEFWQIDTQLSTILEEYEEVRDSILLFVFSVPIFPVSETMQEIMIDFHIFEPDETYIEMQSILNEFFNETPKCQRSYLAWKYLDSLPENECENTLQKVEATVPFTCDGCGKDIKNLQAPFITRIEVYPSRNLKFDYEDSEEKDFEKEVASALESASLKGEKELTKEVWTEYRLFLCQRCRNTFTNRIENGEFI